MKCIRESQGKLLKVLEAYKKELQKTCLGGQEKKKRKTKPTPFCNFGLQTQDSVMI